MALPEPAADSGLVMLEYGLSLLGLLQALAALGVLGSAPGYLQRRILAGERGRGWSVLWLVVPPLAAGLLLDLALSPDVERFLVEQAGLLSEHWLPGTFRMAAMLLVITAGMLLSAGWWDRIYTLGLRRIWRSMKPLLIPGAILMLLGWLVLALAPRPAGLASQAPGSVNIHFSLMLLLLIVGINAGGLARAWANRGWDRLLALAAALVPTLMGMILTYWLLTLTLHSHGTEWSAAQILLGSDVDQPVTLGRMLGRWMVIYFVGVHGLALGGWGGIRLAPRPKIRATGQTSAPEILMTHFKETVPPERPA